MIQEGRKLLVADDEENVRAGIAGYIRRHSDLFDIVYEADDGDSALNIVITYKPDIMLIDVQMPGMTGLEVIAEATRMNCCPKAIILSGYDEFGYVQKALRLGACDYMLKPCRPDDILKLLEATVCDDDKKREVKDHNKPQNRIVLNAIRFIEENYMNEKISLRTVADFCGVSAPYLSSLFSQEEGCGFSDYINKIRIDRACSYLHDPVVKTYEIAYKVGYRDEKYFARVFKKLVGLPPSEYRKHIEL